MSQVRPMETVAHYCTYFDHRYLSQALALYASMRRHCAPFRLWILCLSDECHRVISSLELADVVPLRLAELEAHDAELVRAKSGRSLLEYYFTCGPALMAWLMASRTEINALTYLDADIFFFARPQLLLDELGEKSIIITPHNFSKANQHMLRSGIYNVAWVSFCRDAEGLACLRWWHQSCLEVCNESSGGYYDQKHLEEFPKKFTRVAISIHPGVNLAPWNLANYRLSANAEGRPLVDGLPVIFFHFSKLWRISSFLWGARRYYKAPMNGTVRSLLYRPYIRELTASEWIIRDRFPSVWALQKTGGLGARGAFGIKLNSIRGKLAEAFALIVKGGAFWVFGRRVL